MTYITHNRFPIERKTLTHTLTKQTNKQKPNKTDNGKENKLVVKTIRGKDWIIFAVL